MKLLQLFSGVSDFYKNKMRTFRTKLKLLQDCSISSISTTYSHNKKNNFKLNIIKVSKKTRTIRTGDFELIHRYIRKRLESKNVNLKIESWFCS